MPTWCPATESQHTSSPHPGLIPQDLVPEMSCHASGSTQEALQFWDKGPLLSVQSWISQLLIAAGLVFLFVIYIFLDLIFICYILGLQRA